MGVLQDSSLGSDSWERPGWLRDMPCWRDKQGGVDENEGTARLARPHRVAGFSCLGATLGCLLQSATGKREGCQRNGKGWPLIQGESICHRAMEPMHHSY